MLVNPNIATVQTRGDSADEVYLVPLTVDAVSAVIAREKPEAIMLQFGGQTALNVGIELQKAGVLRRHNVRVLGTPLRAIQVRAPHCAPPRCRKPLTALCFGFVRYVCVCHHAQITEDREEFAALLRANGEPVLQSRACESLDAALAAAAEIGYPVVARAAFALGGLGSGIVSDEAGLRTLVTRALSLSPQVLVEKSVAGWKEVEYEVVRDRFDNTAAICNMENIDGMGVHTGDSVVVAPSQTLDDEDYHALRSCALRVAKLVGIVGECNVQFALDPNSRQFYVIEMNARLSRSSALASKATGYPIAAVAARLALGSKLPRLRNAVTAAATTANFEPALDYVVVKAPRWDSKKFGDAAALPTLGTQMSSVGETMGIGRTFPEAFFKAMGAAGAPPHNVAAQHASAPLDELVQSLARPTPTRLWALVAALRRGADVDAVARAAFGVTPHWVHALAEVAAVEARVRAAAADAQAALQASASPSAAESLAHSPLARLVRRAKQLGTDDAQLAALTGVADARRLRKVLGVQPAVKQIDTLAGEFGARANYLYVTYGNAPDNNAVADVRIGADGEPVTLVLGSGVYRIGASVEFDYGCVSAARTLRQLGRRTAIIK